MNAGFARACITPAIGTPMQGVAARGEGHGCVSVHDDLFARALYIEHADEPAVIIGLDLFGLDPDTATHIRTAVAGELTIAPDRVMLNTSGTRCGPCVSWWNYDTPDANVLKEIETAAVFAACQAHNTARPATMWAGETRTVLPLNTRRIEPNGVVVAAPNPDGPVCDTLPVCLIRDQADAPIAALFSVACDASTIAGFEISADYPGAAMAAIDEELGTECALFVQGAGADARPGVTGRTPMWSAGDWNDVREAGRLVACEVTATFATGLTEVDPYVRCSAAHMRWPLVAPPGPGEFEVMLEHPLPHHATPEHIARRKWAGEQLALSRMSGALPTHVDVSAHGIQIAGQVRLVGLQGAAVAELGHVVREAYPEGVTFALGATGGTRLCLPTTKMLYEGGDAVTGYYQYHHPAPLARGMEHHLRDALEALRLDGVL
jgi:hypothetical protein